MGDTIPLREVSMAPGAPVASTTTAGRQRYLIRSFEWKDGMSKHGGINSVDELEGQQDWDLKILLVETSYPTKTLFAYGACPVADP
jgi:hypothetical protein